MSRPTMDEMRERDKAAREAAAPKTWLVELDLEVTYTTTVEVEALNEKEAREVAREAAEFMSPDDYDEPYIDGPSVISISLEPGKEAGIE